MPDGMMNGVRSGLSARMQYNDGTYSYELFYAPKEILFPGEFLDMHLARTMLRTRSGLSIMMSANGRSGSRNTMV